MTDSTIRVYVDARPVDVAPASTVLEAVRAVSAELADAVVAGSRRVTDGRGLPIAPDAQLESGAILRLVSARAARES